MAEKYGAYCHTVARNVLGNDADAEECVNDAYLAVWNAIPRAQPQNLLAYLAKTTGTSPSAAWSTTRPRSGTAASTSCWTSWRRSSREGSVEDEAAQGELVEAINTFLKEKATRAERQLLPPPVLLGGLHPGPGPGLPVQREQGEIPPFPGAEAAAGLPGGKGVDGVKGLYELLDALTTPGAGVGGGQADHLAPPPCPWWAAVVAVIAAVWFHHRTVRHPREDVGARSA